MPVEHKPRISEECLALIEEVAAKATNSLSLSSAVAGLKDSEIGRRLLAASPEEQRALVIASVQWLDHRKELLEGMLKWADPKISTVHSSVLELLKRRLPFEHGDLITLLDWSARQSYDYKRGASQMIQAVERYLKGHTLTSRLQEKIGRLVAVLESGHTSPETRRWAVRLKELGDLKDLSIPLAAGDAWSDAAIEEIGAMDDESRSAWVELLNVCTTASGSKPTARWSKTTELLLEKIGQHAFESAVLRWFSLVDRPGAWFTERRLEWPPDPNQVIQDKNADILKALAWLCAREENAEIARALTALALSTYRKVPQVGPRNVKVGNACVWALGNMPGTEGIGQLALLKVRVKFGTAQKGIEKALNAAAERAGMPREEIEEMSVPAYGLQEVGVRRETLGGFTAELVVTGTNSTELRWKKFDGKAQKSVPKAVKEGYAEELKELKGAAKDIQKMLPAQRDRIEDLYLEQRGWSYPVWRERYLDHPLVGTLARRLIWRFSNGDRSTVGVFHDGQMLDRTGRVLDWLDDDTRIELWHPIGESPGEVVAWRDWLAELEIRQPFKQAHREVYLLTDAERNTRTYSNRFAAHVLKQHQFNALCAARSWKNQLRLMVDDEYPPATLTLLAHGLRAEFWVEGIGEDINETGTYLYLATDQVRFYDIEAQENSAHASGGGYSTIWRGQDTLAEPLTLEEVPPLVLSEVMRDVDLFVGVASVGNDPNWSDGGPEGRYRDYWESYSFGGLTATAKTRREVLERLVPRLKISGRCHLTERFLVVEGELRTYKIHLGSGNILMEPNDQYLCIVPSQGARGEQAAGKVFLPFEGDRTLAVILSKAFLLVEDKKIKDPTIVRQIRA